MNRVLLASRESLNDNPGCRNRQPLIFMDINVFEYIGTVMDLPKHSRKFSDVSQILDSFLSHPYIAITYMLNGGDIGSHEVYQILLREGTQMMPSILALIYNKLEPPSLLPQNPRKNCRSVCWKISW